MELSVTHSTFVIERRYPTTPERVFAAFADPAKKRRWFAEGGGSAVEAFTMDFRVGGSEHSRYLMGDNTPFPGVAIANDSKYLDIVPGRRIVLAYSMTLGEKRISASLATVELSPAKGATDLVFTDQGAFFEGSDGPQIREAGWRKLFDALATELAS